MYVLVVLLMALAMIVTVYVDDLLLIVGSTSKQVADKTVKFLIKEFKTIICGGT